jgi:PAS domain S-box-containing protein
VSLTTPLPGLIDAVPDAVIVTDAEGLIVFVNASCESMFGYAREELHSMPIETLVPEQRRAAHVAAREGFARAPVARPMGVGMVLTGRKKDGTEIPVDVSLGTLRAASGVHFIAVARDATARLRDEEELRRSEQRYRDLFESADGVFIASPDGRCTDVNTAACLMLGCAREEVIGRPISEFVAPDSVARQNAVVQELRAGATDISEWELRRKDGTLLPIEVSSNALPDGRLRGVARDISERRRAEEAIRRSEESLARAQSVAQVGSFDWDVTTGTVRRSAELCALCGIAPEARSVRAWNFSERIHPEDGEAVLGALQAAERDGRAYRLEHRIVRPDGTERVVLHQGDAVMEGGRVVRVVGTMLDITERKRAEGEREEALQEIQAVLDQCPVGLVIARGASGESLKLNARALALTRQPFDHAGEHGDVALTPDGLPLEAGDNPALRALRGERFESAEFLLRRPDGSRIPVSVSGAPVAPVPDAGGAVPKAIVAFQDITAVKDLERLRSEWSAIVAHDLRHPLNAIALHAVVLGRAIARGRDGPLTGAPESAETILRSAARLNRMIDDLLDLSRLEARRLVLARRPTDLAALVRSIVGLLGANDDEHPIDLRVEGSVPLVNVDPDRITQVIENLLSNAMKYGTRGRPIVVDLGATPDRVHVAVTSEGAGIAPDDLPRVFARFVRTDGAKPGGATGLGLGLYIAHELVVAHGGEITAESAPDGRTTFRFAIPIQADAGGRPPPHRPT